MTRQGDENQFQGQGEAGAKQLMGNPQEKGRAWSLASSCPAGHWEGSLFTWKSGIGFKARCFSKDASLWYHDSVVRNQEVINLTHSFQKSVTTTRIEFKLYQSILSLSNDISFCTRQIWEDKRASNRASFPKPQLRHWSTRSGKVSWIWDYLGYFLCIFY